MKWKWIDRAVVIAIHDYQIAEHGGRPGIRDIGLIQSALDSPKNLDGHEDPDVFDLAAQYGWSITRNHGFIDGNKRTAYVTTRLFLRINGWDFQAPAVECVLVFERLGSGEILADDLADWLRRHATKSDDPTRR
ncbi:MAG: type II toxin-antitoxin system death-on-curing family toxin [Desulfobacterales bacterium]|nr:type II toxin-antitoxin system death-on-curing family toxin [Desulfobacterales bacterium]